MAQSKQRSYQHEVLDKLTRLSPEFEAFDYGQLRYDDDSYTLHAVKSRVWRSENPSVLITGGVHGYETSGVQGALKFALTRAPDYFDEINFLIAPCVSPWGYETINRWNPHALDPNRSFFAGSDVKEATLLMKLLDSQKVRFTAHFDLHESTKSDALEFWPALAARDGTVAEEYEVADGFLLVGDMARPAPDFQRAIIDSVRDITHIAPADADGKLLGEFMTQPGAMSQNAADMHVCMTTTDAEFVVTTEVYPDSDRITPALCTQAQVAAVVAGLDFILGPNKG